jgi:hypothetical protein
MIPHSKWSTHITLDMLVEYINAVYETDDGIAALHSLDNTEVPDKVMLV